MYKSVTLLDLLGLVFKRFLVLQHGGKDDLVVCLQFDSSVVERKADKADAKWCGTAPHERPGPVRKFLDSLPDVEPLCWGAYGEVSEGVRRLVKSLALEMAKDSERCADFNCTGYEQAQGVIAWHFTRHFGRTSVITAAQVKIHQLQCVGGSQQAAPAGEAQGA